MLIINHHLTIPKRGYCTTNCDDKENKMTKRKITLFPFLEIQIQNKWANLTFPIKILQYKTDLINTKEKSINYIFKHRLILL